MDDELNLNPEDLRTLILNLRALMAQEEMVSPDSGSNPTDDDAAPATLQDSPDNLTRAEIATVIEDLEPDQQAELVALMWVGRGDMEPEEWEDALALAADRRKDGPTAAYLLSHPHLAEHWDEGLDRLFDLLMRRYYLAAKAIWRFNQILLANLFDRVTPRSERKVKRLDDEFQAVNVNLEIRDEKLFERRPAAILKAFRLLQDHRDLVGFGPKTLRALSRALPKVGRGFRQSPQNRRANNGGKSDGGQRGGRQKTTTGKIRGRRFRFHVVSP